MTHHPAADTQTLFAAFLRPRHPSTPRLETTCRQWHMIESSAAVGPWRERIAIAAHAFISQHVSINTPLPFTGQPLALTLKFVMPRPVSTPKRRATPAAIKRPDIDKLIRAVCDALTESFTPMTPPSPTSTPTNA